MMLTGARLPVAEAYERGLLAAPPVPREELLGVAFQLAERIAAATPLAVRLILSAARSSLPSVQSLDHEASVAAVAISSDEAKQRIAAFLDRKADNR
jgi:enoyl-CoA hydratase/carnithine racemase